VVGRGGYGEVYCGILDDGRAVAVKRLAASAAVAADEKKEKDFLTELGTVGHVRHPNVSSLLGCCVDRGLHLVFEFSTRGSVSANLHGKSSFPFLHTMLCFSPSDCLAEGENNGAADEKRPAMSWRQRHGVAVGTARGLRYLHKGCARRIIHRDIKASNILLDADYEPQVRTPLTLCSAPIWLVCLPCSTMASDVHMSLPADFRLRARPVAAVGVDAPCHRAHRGHLRVSPPAALTLVPLLGQHDSVTFKMMLTWTLLLWKLICSSWHTYRCLAPEYFTHGIVDEKTDVFAFGVFLLELISGRKPVDGSHMSLLAWVSTIITCHGRHLY
jgi:serine/threonine protein kinase